jgi:hypothetical protein
MSQLTDLSTEKLYTHTSLAYTWIAHRLKDLKSIEHTRAEKAKKQML